MNKPGHRLTIVVAISSMVGLMLGCSSRSPLSSSSSTTQATTSSTDSTVTPSTSKSAGSGSTSSSTSRATVRTDGGTVEVEAADARLTLVNVSTIEAWEFQLRRQDEHTIEGTFVSGNSRTAVLIELTSSGIRTSTSAES